MMRLVKYTKVSAQTAQSLLIVFPTFKRMGLTSSKTINL